MKVAPQTNDQIFHLMQDELRKVHALGVKIDMSVIGLRANHLQGFWLLEWAMDDPDCAVCAIGADLLSSRITAERVHVAFAKRHGRTHRWGLGYMRGSAPDEEAEKMAAPNREEQGEEYCDGWDQGVRIHNWVMTQKGKGNL